MPLHRVWPVLFPTHATLLIFLIHASGSSIARRPSLRPLMQGTRLWRTYILRLCPQKLELVNLLRQVPQKWSLDILLDCKLPFNIRYVGIAQLMPPYRLWKYFTVIVQGWNAISSHFPVSETTVRYIQILHLQIKYFLVRNLSFIFSVPHYVLKMNIVQILQNPFSINIFVTRYGEKKSSCLVCEIVIIDW